MSVGLNVWSQTASNNSTSDTNINWAEGMPPSQVNDSARAMMASMAKWRDDNNGTIVTGGTTVAYTATTSQVEAALTAGYTVALQFHATNDSSATLAVDGLTAKPLQVVAGTNLAGGEFLIGNNYQFTYSSSGTGQWIAQGAEALGKQANIVSTVNITNSAVTYAKIQNETNNTLLGNVSGGAAAPEEITIGTGFNISGTTLNAGNFTPVVSVFTSTAAATWQSTTQGSGVAFPLYLLVRMAGGGGGGGATNTNSGSSGTDTSFSNWTAGGANKGTPTVAGVGGTGGTNGTGTLIRRLTGQAGSAPNQIGGASALGGAGVPTASTGGNAVANSGGGGAGGAGGAGGGGAEYVEFIITSPSTAYSYTVGAGGAGGAAGGAAGGNGAAGRIEVISYWQ